ncbi:MAG: DNA polymerase III subunit alpha, partial [Planctomycetota bacterium]|nr:DNA polymerase III subunit alpha [Planctomycetota bacterium]
DDKELMALKKNDARIRELFDIAIKLEGLNRHQSTHAAGVVIGDAPLIDMVPLYRNKKGGKKGAKDEVEMVSQWSMEDLENIGMLKMDFLGLRTLTIIDRCVKEIRKTRNEEIKIDEVSLDDPATFDLLCKGESTAVFQLESQGMKRILQDLRPDRFEDIIALIALYRPGPIEGGMIDNYVDRKHGREDWTPEHPILEPILKETNGVILYQEQVMRIANKMANFDLSEADTLRRAMGKKKKALMAAFTDQFVEGSVANDVPKDLAKKIFHQIEQFAGYGFNKSHSAAYAILSYQTAYLKANYPAEFMAAVMTCEMGNTDKIVENLEECRRMGIEFRAPDINTSEKGFTVVDNTIWYGLEAIKGLGAKVVDGMIAARQEGLFKSIFDLCERVEGNSINKSALEQLIKSGAFDCFNKKRSQLMEVVSTALKRGASARKDKEQGQLVFVFDTPAPADGAAEGESSDEPDISYPPVEEWSESDKLSLEKESLGFYLSGHPLKKWWSVLENYTNSTVEKHLEISEGSEVCLGVLITKLDKRVARRTGKPFWIAAVEDMDNSTEFFINQKLYDQYGEFLQPDRIILAVGRIYTRATGKGFGVDRIIPVEKVPELMTRDVSIYIPRERDDVDKLKYNLKNVLEKHNGRCPVYIVEPNGGDSTTRVEVSPSLYVTPDFKLFEEIQNIFGENCLRITNTG